MQMFAYEHIKMLAVDKFLLYTADAVVFTGMELIPFV